jgi:predicted  nucleic acid-binding Zn-ribbon protein
MDSNLKIAMDNLDAIETEVGAVPKTPKRELTSVEKNAAALAAAEALHTELRMDQYTLNVELRAKQAEVYRIEERIAMVETRIKTKKAEILGELK